MKNIVATNEFNQVVGNSLGKDAWRRLRKTKMAVIGMIIVIICSIYRHGSSPNLS